MRISELLVLMDIDLNNSNGKESEAESLSGLSGSNLLLLSLISALVYLALALLLFYFFHDGSMFSVFAHGYTVPVQLGVGTGAGVLAAIIVIWISGRPPVSEVLYDFYLVREISKTRFSNFDRIQLSFFAGTGEELLFRGAMQPLMGIWFTSVIFVAIHGYFKFQKAGHWVFGGMMFALSMLLGYLFEYAGLIAAMSAHAIYDVLMLWWVQIRR